MMRKVLLIDDDPITNVINKKLIENSGLANEIVIAQNGKQGLDILLASNLNNKPLPDIILLDINMPILNGFQFLQRLQEINFLKTITIAILSSSDNAGDKARAKSFGIKHFHIKPVTFDFIKQILE